MRRRTLTGRPSARVLLLLAAVGRHYSGVRTVRSGKSPKCNNFTPNHIRTLAADASLLLPSCCHAAMLLLLTGCKLSLNRILVRFAKTAKSSVMDANCSAMAEAVRCPPALKDQALRRTKSCTCFLLLLCSSHTITPSTLGYKVRQYFLTSCMTTGTGTI